MRPSTSTRHAYIQDRNAEFNLLQLSSCSSPLSIRSPWLLHTHQSEVEPVRLLNPTARRYESSSHRMCIARFERLMLNHLTVTLKAQTIKPCILTHLQNLLSPHPFIYIAFQILKLNSAMLRSTITTTILLLLVLLSPTSSLPGITPPIIPEMPNPDLHIESVNVRPSSTTPNSQAGYKAYAVQTYICGGNNFTAPCMHKRYFYGTCYRPSVEVQYVYHEMPLVCTSKFAFDRLLGPNQIADTACVSRMTNNVTLHSIAVLSWRDVCILWSCVPLFPLPRHMLIFMSLWRVYVARKKNTINRHACEL